MTDRGFTGHRQNNTGTYDLKLIYMNARYYHPQLGRFVSPDTIVPEPANPQSFNRYSYALNSPLKYTDPIGHCVFLFGVDTLICLDIAVAVGVVITAGVLTVDLAPQTSYPMEDMAEELTDFAQQVVDTIAYQLKTSKEAKPLTEDEEELIDDIEQIPDWLAKHPDLAEDAAKVAARETLPKGRDHVIEAHQRINSLDKAITHLGSVRQHRTEEAQEKIDAALEEATRYRKQLVDIVGNPNDSSNRGSHGR